MRILWLKAGWLLPLDKGGNLRTWHLMKQIAQRHEITFLAFSQPHLPAADFDGMREVAAHVERVPREEPARGSWRFYLDVALHLLDPLPYTIGRYRSRAFRSRLRQLTVSGGFDLIVCDFLPPAVNMPKDLPCPAVLFTHNVESEIWRRHAETAVTRLSRWLYRLQHRRMLRFEGRTLGRFRGVLAVSENDVQTFARLFPYALSQAAEAVPTGVDVPFFAASSDEASQEHASHLVFTGWMDWLPNEDAMLFFCRQILPLVRAQVPDVTVAIIGRAPSAAVRALADIDGVSVTGRVEDVRPHVQAGAVFIIPLRVGGGTRLKIFEAMAMGKAVVSTTVGAEGLPVVDGTHLLLADGPAAFAKAVVSLLRDPERRRQLGAAAKALVVEKYDWSAAAVPFEQLLVRFADQGRQRPGDAVAAAATAETLASAWRGRSPRTPGCEQ